jgi:tetratricopeptide (TPR) repeat protein
LLIDPYQRTGDLVAAEQAAEQTLEIAPDDALARRAIDHPPVQDAAFWIDLSLAQYRQAMYGQSMQSARRALALQPGSAEAWNNIAANDEALRRWDEAIAAARNAVALKPDFQLAKNNLAWSLAQRAAAK